MLPILVKLNRNESFDCLGLQGSFARGEHQRGRPEGRHLRLHDRALCPDAKLQRGLRARAGSSISNSVNIFYWDLKMNKVLCRCESKAFTMLIFADAKTNFEMVDLP